MDKRAPQFFEGVASGSFVDGENTTNFADTILLQVDFSSAPLQGWLTRTQCLKDINGDEKHSSIGELGSCVEELKGACEGDVLTLETIKVIETRSSGDPWKQCRYTLKLEDYVTLAGKVEFMEGSSVESTQYLRLRIRNRPGINVLRWEGATTEEPGRAAGHEFQSWNLFVLEWNPSPGDVEAPISEVNCLKKIDGNFELSDDTPGFLRSWASEFGGAESTAIGTYDQETSQVTLKQNSLKLVGLKNTDWPKKDYKFTISEDMTEMVGESTDPNNRKGYLRLRAKNHLILNLSVSSDSNTIICTSLFGGVVAELPQIEESVAQFRAKLAASLPHRGLSIDRLKLVLPSGNIVEESQNDSLVGELFV